MSSLARHGSQESRYRGSMTDVRQCHAPVPDALRGDLKRIQCRLVVGPDGIHDGDHKAHYIVRGVGRVTFRWKTNWRKQPPVVILPPPSSDVLNPRARFREM